MKILITSDIHFHLWKEFDRLTSDGKSYRLSLYEKTYEFIRQYCKLNNITYLIDAGDIFHSRDSISVAVLDTLGKQLSLNKAIGIKQYFLKGNHDTSNKSGSITSLNILSEYGTVVDNECVLPIEDILVHFIPWDERGTLKELINITEFTDIVVAHRMLKGAKHNNMILDGESLEGLDYSRFDNIFCGHVHEHQKIQDKVFYIGSLIGHNFNDINQDKGFIVYDSNTKTFERIINPFSPKYIKLKIDSIEDYNNVKDELKENDCSFYDIQFNLKNGQKIPEFEQIDGVRISIIQEENLENRLENANLLTPQILLEKYKELNNLDDEIYKVGKEILEESLI